MSRRRRLGSAEPSHAGISRGVVFSLYYFHPFTAKGFAMRTHVPIVVFSHLRWNFVYQRPQHLLTRLGAKRPILFIEEPILAEGEEPTWEMERPEANVQVCRPRTPLADPGFADGQLALLSEMLPAC